jgi:hypothetical protein
MGAPQGQYIGLWALNKHKKHNHDYINNIVDFVVLEFVPTPVSFKNLSVEAIYKNF